MSTLRALEDGAHRNEIAAVLLEQIPNHAAGAAAANLVGEGVKRLFLLRVCRWISIPFPLIFRLHLRLFPMSFPITLARLFLDFLAPHRNELRHRQFWRLPCDPFQRGQVDFHFSRASLSVSLSVGGSRSNGHRTTSPTEVRLVRVHVICRSEPSRHNGP